jgi:hypothetical protein
MCCMPAHSEYGLYLCSVKEMKQEVTAFEQAEFERKQQQTQAIRTREAEIKQRQNVCIICV